MTRLFGRFTAMTSALLAAPSAEQEAAPVGQAPEMMRALAPNLARHTDDTLFGEIWNRPGLGRRDRSLVTVASLIATGRTDPLKSHLVIALTNGVTATELSGVITHLAFYSGWPRSVDALRVAEEVFREHGVKPDRPGASPLAALPASDSKRAAMVESDVGSTNPSLATLTNKMLFSDVWRQRDLTPRDRSLVTIAALTAGGDGAQLDFHIGRGMENGLTRPELVEAITHLAFYAGWPKAMTANAALARTESSPVIPSAAPGLHIVRPAIDPQRGPADRFTGNVTVSSAFTGSDGSRVGGATVHFEPRARSNWHSHPLGQLLVVTDGEGRIQRENGSIEIIRAGDTVWTPPGVKHWHGAAPDKAMTHVAIQESIEGSNVTWLEPVTDDAYGQPVGGRN